MKAPADQTPITIAWVACPPSCLDFSFPFPFSFSAGSSVKIVTDTVLEMEGVVDGLVTSYLDQKRGHVYTSVTNYLENEIVLLTKMFVTKFDTKFAKNDAINELTC